ncbi:MAG TPA: CTP pyrophosphohydrolase [Treponema sp.]|jgi:8-oxo-dGTP diphosphatase|nr:CTP pyrophosphohydrolase [Treponema sp.]
MSKTSVTGIALDGRLVLVAHRNPTGQMGGRWEFPGGKVDGNETDQVALAREFKEEFNVKVKVGESVASTQFEHNGQTVNLHAYIVKPAHKGIVIKYKLTEHTEYRWVDIDTIKTMNFVDSDLKLYPDVRKYVLSGGSAK